MKGLALAAVAAAGLSGCSSLGALRDGDLGVYAGVRRDLEGLEREYTWCCSGDYTCLAHCVLGFDLPLSAVVDTALLPVTGVVALFRRGAAPGTRVDERSAAAGAAADATRPGAAGLRGLRFPFDGPGPRR